MPSQSSAVLSLPDSPPREHTTIVTYHCWRCRQRSFVRRTYTIDWVDGRPRRVYELAFFAGTLRCPTCNETLDFVGQLDAEGAEPYCARLCIGARHPRTRCQCKTCGGAAHGVLADA